MVLTLVYKRTHNGDPNTRGVFGCNDCMGQVRAWPFGAVIGIGGQGDEIDEDIAGRINWVGIGPHKRPAPRGWGYRGPLVTFDHFRWYAPCGPLVCDEAPNLANRMHGVRATMTFGRLAEMEIEELLAQAEDWPPSPALIAQPRRHPQRRCRSTC